MYNYAVLDPRNIPAAPANDKVFESPVGVLGLEVTLPALAARCMLGNIDAQHTGGYQGLPALDPMWARNDAAYEGDDKWRFTTAIQLATTCALPPVAATLATIRPDLDSVGAMAVLSLRAKGAQTALVVRQDGKCFCPACGRHVENAAFMDSYYECEFKDCRWREDAGLGTPETTCRIWQVAKADNFAQGGWPGPRPLPTPENPWPSEGAADSTRSLAAIAAAVADFKVPIAERVKAMERWLLTGEEPAGCRERVEKERVEMIAAIANGDIKPEAASDGKISVVVSTHRAATTVGYSLAPVVVALNPVFRIGGSEPHKKFTICQFTDGYVDLKEVAADLSGEEAGWGGSPTIIGSPQGVSSTLTLERVAEVVAKHLK